MIFKLWDVLTSTGLDAVFTQAPDSFLIMTLLALGATITAAFPMLSTSRVEFSLFRIFILSLFLLWPGELAAYFALASLVIAFLVRLPGSGRRAVMLLLRGILIVLVLAIGPKLIARHGPVVNHQIAILYMLPPLLALEIALHMIFLGRYTDLAISAGRTMLNYLATLPLTLMTVIMILHLDVLGSLLALVGFLGFSFIGRSINRKHERNTERIREISQQDRLATILMESTSYTAFLEILGRGIFTEEDSEVLALTRTGEAREWVLWSSKEHETLTDEDIKGNIPGKCEFTPDLRIGQRTFTALGLSDLRELILLLSGPEREELCRTPESLLENLVLLLEHTWEAVGHSLRSERSFLAAAVMLARLADAKDDYTHGHSLRVANLSCALGRQLGLSGGMIKTLRVAAILHDIGKLAIPVSILTKRGLLTRREREVMEAHSLEGAKIVSGLSGYEEVAQIIKSHHERLDGQGYPERLTREEIPFMARIVAVADTFDAITSDRSYHAISGWEKALDTIKQETGTKFDARIILALEEVLCTEGEA